MKRVFSLLLVCALLAVLAVPAQADTEAYSFTQDTFPRMDGSTSMVPLGQAIASVLLGIPREEAAGLIRFNRTTQSFRNLSWGDCDIVIAAEPKNEVFQEMREAAFPYLMETIAREALVFVVNESNPVNSLTSDQLRGIYSGEITNWKEVGGEDLPIEAFQRNAAAGSQVMMEKLVMQGTPMMEAPLTHVPAEMAGLIEAVKNYDNSANAIGYTVFYYAADMQMAQGLKILRVDGIQPSVETIQSEEYPFINGYYCCISAAADRSSPEYQLFRWLISEEGQKLLALEGYVPVSAGEGESSVRTDYTHYVPNGRTAAQYTEFDCPKDHLEPSERYGLIYPYSGPEMFTTDFEWEWAAGRMHGFYTHSGERITDPVYTEITWTPLTDIDSWYGAEDYCWSIRQGEYLGFAAKDGSFVSEICYEGISTLGNMLMCERSYEDGTFDLFDKDFRLIGTEKDFSVGDGWLVPSDCDGRLLSGVVHTPGMEDYENYRCALMDLDGRLLMETNGYISLQNGIICCYDTDWNVTAFDRELNRLMFGDEEVFQTLYSINDNFFYASTLDGRQLIMDRNGAVFDWDVENYSAYYEDGSFCVSHSASTTVYSASGQVLYRDVPNEWEYIGEGIFSEQLDKGLRLWNLADGNSVTLPDVSWCYRAGALICGMQWAEDESVVHLLDNQLNLIARLPGGINEVTDVFNAQKYLVTYDNYGFTGEQRLMTADFGTQLFRTNGTISPQNDCITVTDDWSFRACTPDGTVIFCYPFIGMGTGD